MASFMQDLLAEAARKKSLSKTLRSISLAVISMMAACTAIGFLMCKLVSHA